MERVKFIICGVVLLLAASCAHKSKRAATMPPIGVEITTAQSKLVYDRIEVASQISSLYEAIIQPRIDGFLESINYSEGMPIKSGELIFVIDPSQYNIALLTARADLESAHAQEILARSNYQRAIPLAQIDAISQSDLDQYTATHSAAKASVKSAAESVNNAELNLTYTHIYAPIDGIIAQTPAKEGDYVGPSTSLSTLTTISYIDTVEVDIPFPTKIYIQNRPTKSDGSIDNSTLLSNIEITLSGGEFYNYLGEYSYTLQNTPSASSTVVVVAKFPNPDLQLKSGMFAKVRANIGEPKSRITAPQEAISQSQGVNSVWVMKPDSTVEFREVKLGNTIGSSWIIESGVKEGESLLISGQMKVHNGAKVNPIKR